MDVVVTKYNELWSKMFDEESLRIKRIFGDEIIGLHHIGSTSVPGLRSKPIIDMMPIVQDLAKIDGYNHQMEQLGYECMGEFGMIGRRYFRKGGDHRTHQIHMFQNDNPKDTIRHLAVRDYLRRHPHEAMRYGELKDKLAALYPKDIQRYSEGKDTFVKELEKTALAWYQTVCDA